MLKRLGKKDHKKFYHQPPSGGCVLKQQVIVRVYKLFYQPPSGGCVLKLSIRFVVFVAKNQPPSGGCVLKHCWTLCAIKL